MNGTALESLDLSGSTRARLAEYSTVGEAWNGCDDPAVMLRIAMAVAERSEDVKAPMRVKEAAEAAARHMEERCTRAGLENGVDAALLGVERIRAEMMLVVNDQTRPDVPHQLSHQQQQQRDAAMQQARRDACAYLREHVKL